MLLSKQVWNAPLSGKRFWLAFRILTLLVFCAALTAYVAVTWRWPLVHDSQVIHYVCFLMRRGWSPYRDIWDMNMPGAYILEGLALRVFGDSDLGWRLYDFTLAGVLIAAMIAIARRYDWLAGLVAGGIFTILHAGDRALMAAQRDQEIAVALVVGFAFCFESVRRRSAWLMCPFGFAVMFAASVKPTMVPLGPFVLTLASVELRRNKDRILPYVLYALAGFGAAVLIVVIFLLSHHSLQAFIFDCTKVLPYYVGVSPSPWRVLLMHTLPRTLYVFVGVALLRAVLDHDWHNWEITAILCGVGFGFLHFYGQRKGFVQHRYITVAFISLWASIQLLRELRTRNSFLQWTALLVFGFEFFGSLPHSFKAAQTQSSPDELTWSLEQDLQHLGPNRLQHNVQCLELVDGCMTSLFHLKVVQSTGSTGDLILFLRQNSWVSEEARKRFLEEITVRPPEVIVLTNSAFEEHRTFNKIQNWPTFANYLEGSYEMAVQRSFNEDGAAEQRNFGEDVQSFHSASDTSSPAYRIYVRRGSPLLSLAEALPAKV